MIKNDEMLDEIVIDMASRQIKLTGSFGNTQIISNNTVKQFMTMVKHIKENAPEDIVKYSYLELT
jgi:hypothetical protein